MSVLEWLKAHWRPVALVAAVLLAFVGGRFSNPGRVETRDVERVKLVQVEDTQSKEMVRVLTAQLTEMKRNMHRVTHTVTKPDGSSETTTVVDSQEQQSTQQHADASKESAAQRHAEAVTEREHTSTKVTTSDRPQWHASLLAGVEPAHLTRQQLFGPVALGLHVERRILGPVWFGAWGVSTGVVGVSLGVEF